MYSGSKATTIVLWLHDGATSFTCRTRLCLQVLLLGQATTTTALSLVVLLAIASSTASFQTVGGCIQGRLQLRLDLTMFLRSRRCADNIALSLPLGH